MTLTLNEFFIRSKPELFAILAAIFLCSILLLVLSIKVSRRREEESLPEGSRRSSRPRKRHIFRKLLITLFVILLIAAIACAALSFVARNGNIAYVTHIESEQISIHYLYPMDNGTYAVATLTGCHCYYYEENGTIKVSITTANDISVKFTTDGSAPRIVEYRETPVRYEMYREQVLEAKRLENETKTYYVLYASPDAISLN